MMHGNASVSSKYIAFYAAKICKLDGMPCPSERNAAAKVRRRVSGEKKSWINCVLIDVLASRGSRSILLFGAGKTTIKHKNNNKKKKRNRGLRRRRRLLPFFLSRFRQRIFINPDVGSHKPIQNGLIYGSCLRLVLLQLLQARTNFWKTLHLKKFNEKWGQFFIK